MSILINGMEMPISCERCPMLDWDLDYIKCKVTDRHFKMTECWRSIRVPDCPLFPVTPHGDLIDREALKAAICSRLCIKDLTYLSPAEKSIVDEINDAPVVIPASADAKEEILQLTNRGKMCEVFGEKDTNEMFAPAGWWDKIYRKPGEEET